MNRSTLLRTLTASVLLLAVTVAGCAQRSVVAQASTESVTGRPDIYIWPNSNSHSNNEATLRLVVKAGSLQETDSQLGYAHFVEHMAFNGTEAFPKSAIQERLNELGMSIGSHSNAYTTFDHTAYTLTLNSVDTERLEAALELLAEWAYRIEFDADEVVKERPVILEEWRQSQPQEDRVGEQLFQHYFAGSRYLDRRPIGTPESINEATGESLKAFYQQWYQPGNMAVIVAGDFDEAEVRSLVERYFPTRETSDEPVQPEQYAINLDAIDDRIAVTDAYTTSGYVDLTYYSEAELPQTPEDLVERLKWEAALDIWYDRAQKRLVSTQGVVSDVNYSWEYASPDLLEVSLSASLSQDDLKTGLQIIENERQGLLLDGITQQELDDWRQGVLEAERPQQDSAGHLAGEMTDHYLQGWPMISQSEWLRLLEEGLPEFTPEQVRQALADKMNRPAKVRIVHPHNEAAPSSADIDNWLANASLSPETAMPIPAGQTEQPHEADVDQDWPINPGRQGKIVKVRALEGDVTEWTLDNGMTVLYRYSDSAPGKVYYTLTGLGGLNILPEQEVISARLALPTLGQSGLRHLDGADLNNWLESRGMAQNPGFDYFDRAMTGNGPVEKFPVMMRLLHVALTEAKVNPSVWTHIRKQNEDYLSQQSKHPHRPWVDMIENVLFRNDPALRTLTPEELAAVTPERMQAVYDTYFAGAQNYRLTIVGDIDRAQVQQSVLAAIATLPASQGDAPEARMYPVAGEPTVQHIEGSGERQATVVLRYGIPKAELGQSVDHLAPPLTQWLDEALMERVREESGSVYSIGADVDGQTRYQQNLTLIIQLATDPDRVEEVVAEVEATLKQLTESAPTSEQIATWHQSQHSDRQQALKVAKHQVSNLAYMPLFDEGTPWALALEAPKQASGQELTEFLSQFIAQDALRVELAWLP